MGIMKKDDTPGLFSAFADRPLADRLRPSALEDIMGQDHLLGEGGPLRLMADSGKMTWVTWSLATNSYWWKNALPTLPLLAMVMHSSNFLTLPSLPTNPSTPLLSAVDDTYGTVPSVWSAFLRRLPRCISVNTSVKLKGFH